ncbi:MAG: CehA/McbA family metallohydrolase [Acidobacteriota bacterium]
MIRIFPIVFAIAIILTGVSPCQHTQQAHGHEHTDPQAIVPLQPLAQQVRQLERALGYLGQPLSDVEHSQMNEAIGQADEKRAVAKLQEILDKSVLAVVEINPESRVKVKQGVASPELVEGGTRLFLVKVINQAGVTAPLRVESPNAGPVYIRSSGRAEPESRLAATDVRERWAEISVYQQPPMRERLSGLPLEYVILEVFSRDQGQRSALISFDVGQGSQDIGFRNETTILFNALPARQVKLAVKDEKGQPTVASFLFRDHVGRVYPNPSKRLAPDFFFQPQVYRADGESIYLPDGEYTVTYSRGPEYLAQALKFMVSDSGPQELVFDLKRWIDPSEFGWYSGDHHIHAAGCSHYENPAQGVLPQDMWNQIRGEALNVGAVLTWGPCYYYQKQFFSGDDHPLSTADQLIHYDLEVSGFPSSHAGHLVLLGLQEQDYPGADRIEEWPTWDLPVLRWGKSQDAVTGFSHSGWGLEVQSRDLPNYEMPGFDGIGANEYIVDVTHPGTVDFISAGDTPYVWELNIWYHTLNVGFRTRISGETDFPCITDDRIGLARSYTKIDGPLNYRAWVEAIRDGRSYVSDGRSHLLDLKVNGLGLGTGGSEVRLKAGEKARVEVQVAAYLDSLPNKQIQTAPYQEKPYWDVERARIGDSREVPVELIMNGEVVASRKVLADGKVRSVEFEVPVERSSWLAVRILPSSHSNPVFALVGQQPIRASRRSAEWCLAAVDQCWSQKARRISPEETEEARQAYDHARRVYRQLILESK